MIGLGFWQLDRAEQKQVAKTAYELRSTQPQTVVGEELLDEAGFEYFNAGVRGVYEPDLQVFEDNRIVAGRPGYYVFTPFRIEGSDTRIMVNRGWIPWGQDITQAPLIETPGGLVTIEGVLKAPTRGYYSLEDSPPVLGQQIWQNFDLDHFRTLVDFPVQPLYLLLSPSSEVGGFKRQWPVFADKDVARHHGYAVQWFAMAFVLVLVFLWATIRKVED